MFQSKGLVWLLVCFQLMNLISAHTSLRRVKLTLSGDLNFSAIPLCELQYFSLVFSTSGWLLLGSLAGGAELCLLQGSSADLLVFISVLFVSQGNKGGVSIRLSFYGHTLCFLNCHLAAHMNYASERVDEFEYITDTQTFDCKKAPAILDHR